jgi:hypothetical protein
VSFASGPLPGSHNPQSGPAPAKQDEPQGLEAMLAEAKLMAFGDEAHGIGPDMRVMKSESGVTMMTLLIRILETLAHGKPETKYKPRHHE